MAVENVNKVDNIVKNNKLEFDKIYAPLLQQLSADLHPGTLKINDGNKNFEIKYTPQIINKTVEKGPFPKKLYEELKEMQTGGKDYKNITEKLLMNGVSLIPKEI